MKPAPMTDTQICEIFIAEFKSRTNATSFANALIKERDKQWEDLLATGTGIMQGDKHVPVQTVYKIDDAEPPEPETGFSLLGELM